MHAFHFRVKKPDEFNRPRIPYSQRKVKTRSSKFLSKKVRFCNNFKVHRFRNIKSARPVGWTAKTIRYRRRLRLLSKLSKLFAADSTSAVLFSPFPATKLCLPRRASKWSSEKLTCSFVKENTGRRRTMSLILPWNSTDWNALIHGCSLGSRN